MAEIIAGAVYCRRAKEGEDESFSRPEAYLMHLTDRCRFLNCSVGWGGGVWGGTL